MGNAARLLRDDDIALTNAPIKQMMKHWRQEIKTLDVMAKSCATPEG
jgi:hypothetical protein